MHSAMRVLALTVIGAAAFVPAAHAQDMTTATVNGTTIWVGGGVQFLSLPTRTMLRLNIGLGSQQLYPEPMK
jgi:hypothetical protein